jgi:2-methylcitrate dehydratase PrpD
MCQPLDERRAPATLADAKFSLPFLVSVAIVRRGMSVTDFSATGLRDAEVLAAGRKISLVSDPALDWRLELPPGRAEIVARDGRSWIREGRGVPGNADNPMTWDDICAKFRECASANVTAIAEEKVTRASAMARSLDDLPDATELIRTLA